MEKRTDKIYMKVLPSVKAMAAERAAEEGRTLSNYIENLIKEDFERRNPMKRYRVEYATPKMIEENDMGLHDLTWGDIDDYIEAENEEEAIELAKLYLIDNGYDEDIEEVSFRAKPVDMI